MLVLFLLAIISQCYAFCKVTPSSAKWPPATAWQALNASVSGRLIRTIAPGAVCFPNRPEYNNASCNFVTSQWTNSSFHRESSVSVDYNDDTCSPLRTDLPCSDAGYPAYAVRAENVRDVQNGIKFAARHGIRLIVKGTGHDYPGRSSGAGALSIWTRHITGIEFGDGKVKIMAGMIVQEILTAAARENVTVVTGSDPEVGIGGWLAGGGHGPVTSLYGMGADQVIEMEVVTADGGYLTINNHTHSDLFWAMRGGGGSTYAVMISATVKTFPNLAVSLLNHNYTAKGDFWDTLTTFHNNIPKISEAGIMGYYYVFKDLGLIITAFLAPEKTIEEAEAILLPMEQQLNANVSKLSIPVSNFAFAWALNQAESVGTDGRLGSRLLDKPALTSSGLKSALQKAMPDYGILVGHIVAGRKPVDNAVLPAWRQAYSHLAIPVGRWTNDTEKEKQLSELKKHVQALKNIAPNTGAYMSEADPSETDWKKTYYGSHYPRLLEIKKKWDPNGVFWCKPCVGNDLWVVKDGDGIGQDRGLLCKAR